MQREQQHAPAPTHAADAARETKPALVAAAAGHSLQGRGFPSLQLSMSPFLWLNVPERRLRRPTGEGKRPETRDEMGPKAARASAAEALVARRVAVGQAQSPFHVSAPALLALSAPFRLSQKSKSLPRLLSQAITAGTGCLLEPARPLLEGGDHGSPCNGQPHRLVSAAWFRFEKSSVLNHRQSSSGILCMRHRRH